MVQRYGLFSTNGRRIALQSVHIDGRLDEILATIAITQRYRNDSEQNLEIVYTFPLAHGAVPLGMTVAMGDKRLDAVVAPRDEAWKRYEDAIDDGDTPVLVEQTASGYLTANLGNVEAGEEVTVELTYAQLPPVSSGMLRLRIPCAIASLPGYQQRDGGLSPHEIIGADIFAEYPLTLRILLTGEAAKAEIKDCSHLCDIRECDDGKEILLQPGAMLDRDFTCDIEESAGNSLTLLAPDRDDYMMFARFRPDLPLRSAPIALKILVDCSSSMAGDGITRAREALSGLLERMRADDHVSYSRFGDAVLHHAGRMRPFRLSEYSGTLDDTQVDMGEAAVERALMAALMDISPPEDDAPVPIVLLITNGTKRWNPEKVLRAAQDSNQRIFILGVGSAPAERLLREMAEKTGGACVFVSPGETGDAAVARMKPLLYSPWAKPLRIDWGLSPVWQSPLPLSLYGSDPVVVFASFAERPAKAPVLLWAVDGHEEALTIATVYPLANSYLARLGGAKHMADVATPTQAMALALHYQVIGEHTPMFLVHARDGAKSSGFPFLYQVPQMMVAGHAGFGTVSGSRL